MASAVCHRFVQNAWRKERCSNCFKSREEHARREAALQRRAATAAGPPPAPGRRGIMRAGGGAARRQRAVSFKADLAEVIGVGGEDWSDDADPDEDAHEDSLENSEEEESSQSESDDKELEKLTKSNTEHNANIAANTTSERRRTFTQLMLGQTQKDAEGKKQTLLVSVTPFGQDEGDKAPLKRLAKSVSHIPIARNKDILVEAKPKVILTSYSKNREFADSGKLAERKLDEKAKSDKIKTMDKEGLKAKKEERLVKMKSSLESKLVQPAVARKADDTDATDAPERKVAVGAGKPDSEESDAQQPVSEEIVKSELSVKLSTPRQAAVAAPEPDTSGDSSEDSADSLGCVAAGSREQAGEPDGRADPDTPPHCGSEAPSALAAPSAPPASGTAPLGPESERAQHQARPSFLHGSPPPSMNSPPLVPLDQPKLLPKPDQPQQQQTPKKSESQPPVLAPPPPIITPPPPITAPPDLSKTPNKRRAPNPPPNLSDSPDLQEGIPLEMVATDPVKLYQEPDLLPPKPPPRDLEQLDLTCFDPKMIPTDVKITTCVSSEEKRKEKSKGRFSLKKLLRVGGGGSSKNGEKRLEEMVREKLKPRLVIVHPLELNGAGVEVMPPGAAVLDDQREVVPPAPPPRNLTTKVDDAKPLTPCTPLKCDEVQLRRAAGATSASDSIYANLGEVRSSLPPPCKPQRTASMREREALAEREEAERRAAAPRRVEHVYERLGPRRRSADDAPTRQGPADDVDLYAPAAATAYYPNGDCELSEGRGSCQLRSRKGRSVVHRNLEDNYGAVVVANHEALAQVLEHLVQQAPAVAPSLRPLLLSSTLRWSEFSVLEGCVCAAGRRRAFHRALWAGAHRVTLAVGGGARAPIAPPGVFTLNPITVFDDLVPARFLPGHQSGDAAPTSPEQMVQATVAVLPWMQVETVQSVGGQLRARGGPEATREACLILLQLVHSLKGVQAQGVEEAPLSLSHVVLCHDPERDTHHRLCLLHGLSEEFWRNDETEKSGSLCQCATVAVDELFPPGKLATLIRSLLKKESAVSLSQVKSILEFFVWGPGDVSLGTPLGDRELALQRWLDLERATVLHGLVGARPHLSVLDQCHLLFLVRSTARIMCEASVLLDANV